MNNNWIFANHRSTDSFMRLANCTSTLERDAAERLVVEEYRGRHGRPPITEWSGRAGQWGLL